MPSVALHKLPPRARRPGELSLFRMRNVQPQVSLAEGMRFLAEHGLPDIRDSDQFAADLCAMERVIGTGQSTMVELLVADGVRDVGIVVEEIEGFEELRGRLPDTIFTSERRLRRLKEYLAPQQEQAPKKLVFGRKQINFRTALHNLRRNFGGSEEQTGNCTICAVLYGLFAMPHVTLAGALGPYLEEGAELEHLSFYAESEDETICYGVTGFDHFFRRFGASEYHAKSVISSMFTFVSVLIATKIDQELDEIHNPVIQLDPDVHERMLQLLACAEVINPFNRLVYQNRALLVRGEEADMNEAWNHALVQLEVSGGMPQVPPERFSYLVE